MAKTNAALQISDTKEILKNIKVSVPEGMKVIIGSGKQFEDIVVYYRFTAPRTPNKKCRVMAKGDTFLGTYDGSFESKTYEGQYTHKIRTAEGLIGLPGCTQLNTLLSSVPQGATVQVVYKGKETIAKGPRAGKQAHGFQVAADRTNE